MPIQIIPKEAAKLPLWQNILFYLSTAILLACLSGFGFLSYLIKKSEMTFEDKKRALEEGKTPQMIILEKEILDWEKKIKDFSFLIESHKMSSKIFGLLEKDIHPEVYFSGLDFDVTRDTVNITGQTDDFQTLGQQIFIFEKDEMVRNVQLIGADVNKEGKVDFILVIHFFPKLFK